MSRKHYREVAAILKARRDELSYCVSTNLARTQIDIVTVQLATMFKLDNPRFDRQRFYDAAGMDQP